MILELPEDEAPKLARVMTDFAAAYKLQVREAANEPPRLTISLCNERLTIKGSPYEITVFETQNGSGWREASKYLIGVIESTWPGKPAFRSPAGGDIPRPKELL